MKSSPLLAVLVLVMVPGVASAQDAPTSNAATPSEAPPDRARAAFERGLAALRDERYADAYEAFQESYQERRVAAVALNLGIALRSLGRLVEARQRFQEFLELANEQQHERYDRDVANYLAEIGRRVGRLRVELSPENARVLLDGRRLILDENSEASVDPGSHRIEAELRGYQPTRDTVTVPSAGRAQIRLVLEPIPTDPRVTAPTENPSIATRWWFWTTIGVVTAAAVGIPLAIWASNQVVDPAGTNTGLVFQTLQLNNGAQRGTP